MGGGLLDPVDGSARTAIIYAGLQMALVSNTPLLVCRLNNPIASASPSIKDSCKEANSTNNILDSSRKRKTPPMEPPRATVIVPLYIWPCTTEDWQPLLER